MVNRMDMILEEIEVLRKRLQELYLQTESLRTQRIVRMSRKLDQKLNIHQKLLRTK
jgi:hypothetical protein